VIAVEDAVEVGGTSTDGCTAPFTNAAAVIGKIAIIERGLCGFAVKARNATEAGAIGVIIYNQLANANAGPPGMADDVAGNGAFVTIPTVSFNRPDGLAVVGGVGVTASLSVDLNIRAGANADNQARMFAPFPRIAGSSVSHYDSIASRNLLMEPAINGDLTHNVSSPDDLTHELFLDIGWFPDADLDGVDSGVDCEPNSIQTATIVIDGIDTGVPNQMFDNGCTMSDLIADAAAASNNHGQFVNKVSTLANGWKKTGLITPAQKDAIVTAAGESDLP
jgi:hypothetical protein